jgi:aminoglycoside phosphotransferase (APT) family kinase protein
VTAHHPDWNHVDPALIQRLSGWLAGKLESDQLVLDRVVTPSQGHSSPTVVLEATATFPGGARRAEHLVVRLAAHDHQLFLDADVLLQWRMLTALSEHSAVPVPRPRFVERDPRVLGVPFFVMDHVPGTVPPEPYSSDGWMTGTLSPDGRRRMWTNGIQVLTDIHNLDWRDHFAFLHDTSPRPPGLDQYLDWLGRWYSWATRGRHLPVFAAGMDAVLQRRPADAEVTVLWGDAKLGNLIYADDATVAAVLDFEMASLGPGELDLAWWLLIDRLYTDRDGGVRPEGLPGRQETIALYERLRGRSTQHLEYYDTVAALRMSLILLRFYDLEIERGTVSPQSAAGFANAATAALAVSVGAGTR